MVLPQIAILFVLGCWFAFGARLLVNHVRVRRERGPEAGPELRAPLSMLGLLLEGVALFMVFNWRRPLEETPAWAALGAMLTGAWSVYFASAAVRHLGRQWRVKAVVAKDHALVTTGPYAVVRHPIYLALMGLALATGLALTRWLVLAAALAVYIIGTEIRVRAEDGILRQRFGAAFEEYRSRVRAYIPFVR